MKSVGLGIPVQIPSYTGSPLRCLPGKFLGGRGRIFEPLPRDPDDLYRGSTRLLFPAGVETLLSRSVSRRLRSFSGYAAAFLIGRPIAIALSTA